jgi:threonine dehydratase
MAKLHIRHMVGGHAPEVRQERLCRFEFPERPGALTEFLDKLGGRWNISLFHYRNHGSDFGRVLAGFEVDDRDLPAFREFLDALGYPYTAEQDNPAYRFFLG